MIVTLSERAADEVKRIIARQQLPETTVLRVGVLGGGCSGYEYRMEFTSETDREDLLGESQGVPIAVDKHSASFVAGMQIDIGEGLNNRGFTFHNPMAVKTCGCGSSFGV